MAQNHQRDGSGSLKERLFKGFGLQSQSEVPSRSVSLPTLHATSKLPKINETSKCYVKSGSKKGRPMSTYTKRGWLRKQSGLLVRSWQARWFVLRNGNLIQFMTDEEILPPVSVLVLRDYVIKELPIDNSNEQHKRYLFEISQGTGGSSTSLRTSDSIILSADEEDDRRDWMRAIKQTMYSERGGAIFGQSLDITMAYEQERNPTRQVPDIVELCVEFIKANGLDAEGVFRLPGRNKVVRELRDAFDIGGTRPSFQDVDVHTVASLLKAYLRDLPHPIVPVDHYDNVMKIITRQRPLDHDGAVKALSAALLQIPLNNKVLLKYLCKFLNEVSLHSDVNKMNATNLATVFCPYIVEPEVDDPALLAGTSPNRTTAVLDMISEFHIVFPAEEDDLSDQQSEGGDSYHTCSAYNTPMPETHLTGSSLFLSFQPISQSINSSPIMPEPDSTTEVEGNILTSEVQELSLSNGVISSAEGYLQGQHSTSNTIDFSDDAAIQNNDGQFQETSLGEKTAGPDSQVASEIYCQVIRLKQQLLAQDQLVADLRQQLANEREERNRAARQSKKLAVKLADEREATAEAVKRVIELQSKLEKYSLKYGPVD